MISYIKAHWNGKLPWWKTVLVNGVLLYLLFVALFVSLADYINVYVGIAFFAIYFIWALVGMFRCGWRIAFTDGNSILRRLGGWTTMVVSVVVFVGSLLDLARLSGVVEWP
jgi:hypothetical protein